MKRVNKPTRVTYIHQHFKPPTENGGGRPYEFARRLVASGSLVTMIAAGSHRITYEFDGIRVEQVGTRYDNTMSVPRRMLAFLIFMIKSTWIAVRQPADVVFASSTPLTVVVPGIIAARARRARLVIEIRDLWPAVPLTMGYLPRWMGPPARVLERIAYSAADTVIALSPSMLAGVRDVNPQADVRMIPNASDRSAQITDVERRRIRSALGVAEDEILFAYAGSLGIGYDPPWLAQFAIALEGHKARLVVVGAGAGMSPAVETLEAAGLDPDRVFLGSRSRSDALQILAASDVAVSSLIDSQALEGNSLNKVFDAFAQRRPILFNHDGWLSELARDAGAGWKVPRDLVADDVISILNVIREDGSRASLAAESLGKNKFDRTKLYYEFEDAIFGTPRHEQT